MPTAAKLVAAIGFALMAYIASEAFKPLLPEGTRVHLLSPVNAGIGALSGWLVMGRLAGRGYREAVSSGLRTAAVAAFYILTGWAACEMIRKSMRLLYDGPMEALVAMMGMIGEYAIMAATDPWTALIIVGGGVVAACLSEWAARNLG
ncbi:TrgA family protein [Roseicyclus sp. F158]|uniref:TrgA family protein n=1 Tax=Tropicimonas omnivorans TaxID=3075590 RepID=A0ABU3DJM8_9RHOB|nr:TrgA family protein [Roseicyclus sp. F158]MDT0683322.1 TrgA family protein [Roseicyclus sp. F158]